MKASIDDLQSAILRKTASASQLPKSEGNRPSGTPLGNFLRGPSEIPTPPHLEELADMFDKMTMEEQRQYLDEDARSMGLFNN